MNWDAIGAIGQMLGSIAVFITLGYLAIQVRQTNRSAALAAVLANRAERREFLVAERDSPYIPGIRVKIRAGEPLDPEESVRYGLHSAAVFSVEYSEWVNRTMGQMGEFGTSYEASYDSIFANPHHLEWWKSNGRRIYPTKFFDFIDAEIAQRAIKGAQ